jgi:hypothetical protein
MEIPNYAEDVEESESSSITGGTIYNAEVSEQNSFIVFLKKLT